MDTVSILLALAVPIVAASTLIAWAYATLAQVPPDLDDETDE